MSMGKLTKGTPPLIQCFAFSQTSLNKKAGWTFLWVFIGDRVGELYCKET